MKFNVKDTVFVKYNLDPEYYVSFPPEDDYNVQYCIQTTEKMKGFKGKQGVITKASDLGYEIEFQSGDEKIINTNILWHEEMLVKAIPIGAYVRLYDNKCYWIKKSFLISSGLIKYIMNDEKMWVYASGIKEVISKEEYDNYLTSQEKTDKKEDPERDFWTLMTKVAEKIEAETNSSTDINMLLSKINDIKWEYDGTKGILYLTIRSGRRVIKVHHPLSFNQWIKINSNYSMTIIEQMVYKGVVQLLLDYHNFTIMNYFTQGLGAIHDAHFSK